ncbi:MAG: NAD-dependent epimerase/dehydratase family protein [Chloroflexi bacterium]|nr:MAG: NAD-dependent epimerase/dehydratase family protein [Chloroflexota bacterium]TMD53047.1 MAG: NAD-dependent epimerase/dehydratase family protein [Chloroflexota bacterium]
MRQQGPVLVTGGAGFIGSHLVTRLAGEGYSVRVLDNLSTGKPSNLAGIESVELLEGDIRSRDQVARAVEGVTAVFHLAALPSVVRSWEDPVQSLAVNAHGTANVAEAAAAAGVDVLVYSSSSSVYGDQAAESKTEDLEPKPISPYGYSKLLAEKLALAQSGKNRLRVLALRYFNVFGSRQDPDSPYAAVIPLFIRHALAGTPATIHGDGKQSRDFTHVDNVVDANLLAFDSSASGVAMNAACGGSHSLLELVEQISALSGRPLEVVHDAPRAGDIRHSRADISLAAAAIGFSPRVSFEEGLRMTYESYRRD